MEWLLWFVKNWSIIAGAIASILAGVIAICLLIPGEQPEKFLQSVLNVLKKISNK